MEQRAVVPAMVSALVLSAGLVFGLACTGCLGGDTTPDGTNGSQPHASAHNGTAEDPGLGLGDGSGDDPEGQAGPRRGQATDDGEETTESSKPDSTQEPSDDEEDGDEGNDTDPEDGYGGLLDDPLQDTGDPAPTGDDLPEDEEVSVPDPDLEEDPTKLGDEEDGSQIEETEEDVSSTSENLTEESSTELP